MASCYIRNSISAHPHSQTGGDQRTMSILPTTHGRWLQVSHSKRITKIFSIPVPSPPPLCGPPWSMIAYLLNTLHLPYTRYDVRTYVHADLHPYMYVHQKQDKDINNTLWTSTHTNSAHKYVRSTYVPMYACLLEKRLRTTGVVRIHVQVFLDYTSGITHTYVRTTHVLLMYKKHLRITLTRAN